MLMQRAHDANGLIVVRGDDRGGATPRLDAHTHQ